MIHETWLTSEGTDHEDTGTETPCGEVGVTELAGNLAETLALVGRLGHEGNEGVSGVGNDRADDTSGVTGGEGDAELSGLRVGLLWRGENFAVEELDSLKGGINLNFQLGEISNPVRLPHTFSKK